LTLSNGSPTNCATRRLASRQRASTLPVARRRTGCCVVGITNCVIMSNGTSTGAVSTK
jgi:hypothetical protein